MAPKICSRNTVSALTVNLGAIVLPFPQCSFSYQQAHLDVLSVLPLSSTSWQTVHDARLHQLALAISIVTKAKQGSATQSAIVNERLEPTTLVQLFAEKDSERSDSELMDASINSNQPSSQPSLGQEEFDSETLQGENSITTGPARDTLQEALISLTQQQDPPQGLANRRSFQTKSDALWKKMLRGFRKFFRIKIHDAVPTLKYLRLVWRIDMPGIEEELSAYLESIGCSEELASQERNLHALIVLCLGKSPAQTRSTLRHIPALSSNLNTLIPTFVTGFRENSERTRVKFFSTELVQQMWRHYTQAEEGEVARYMKGLTVESSDYWQVKALLRSMQGVEERTGFSLLGLNQRPATNTH